MKTKVIPIDDKQPKTSTALSLVNCTASLPVALSNTGFVRLNQIVGNPKANPPIPALIPVGRTTWWNGVKSGRFPAPVKLGVRTTAWTVESIRSLIEQMQIGAV